MAVPGPAGDAGHAIRADLEVRAPTIFDHSYGALLWVVWQENSFLTTTAT